MGISVAAMRKKEVLKCGSHPHGYKVSEYYSFYRLSFLKGNVSFMRSVSGSLILSRFGGSWLVILAEPAVPLVAV